MLISILTWSLGTVCCWDVPVDCTDHWFYLHNETHVLHHIRIDWVSSSQISHGLYPYRSVGFGRSVRSVGRRRAGGPVWSFLVRSVRPLRSGQICVGQATIFWVGQVLLRVGAFESELLEQARVWLDLVLMVRSEQSPFGAE